MGGYDLEHVIHDGDRVCGVGGEHGGEAALQKRPELAQRGIGRGALGVFDPLLQGDDEIVIALQVPARVGEFLALGEQALRQHLATGQRAFEHSPPEGFLLQARHALERPRLLEVHLRVERQQPGGRHHAVVRRQPAVADLALQLAARHADQARRPR